MTRWPVVLPLAGLVLAGCNSLPAFGPAPTPAAVPAPAPAKPPANRFDCTFTGGPGPQYRTLLMGKGQLTEREAPHRHFRITSDDGETIAAKHEARGGAAALLTIDLRQHQAMLTEISATTGEERTLPGTCAERG